MRICSVLFLTLLIVGCESELDILPPSSEWRIVVEGYLASSDSVLIRIDESRNSFDEYQTSSQRGKNAIVHLSYQGAVHTLTEYTGTNPLIQRNGKSLDPTFYFLPRSVFVIPDSGSLNLDVIYGGKQVDASCRVPAKIKILDFHTVLITQWKKDVVLTAAFPVGISYYYLRGKSVGTFQSKPAAVTFMSELIKVTGDGKPKTIHIVNNNGGVSFTSEEKQILVLGSTSKEYYNFYQVLRSQQTDTDRGLDFFGREATEISSNINGGFGIFTIISDDTMSVDIP